MSCAVICSAHLGLDKRYLSYPGKTVREKETDGFRVELEYSGYGPDGFKTPFLLRDPVQAPANKRSLANRLRKDIPSREVWPAK